MLDFYKPELQWQYGRKITLACKAPALLREDVFLDGQSIVICQQSNNSIRAANFLIEASASNNYAIDKVLRFDCDKDSFIASICVTTPLTQGNQCQILTNGQVRIKETLVIVQPSGVVKLEFAWKAPFIVAD